MSARPRFSAADIAAVIAPGKPPTEEQVAVIEAPLRPTLVVAGAGSGKTQTMSLRVVWLVANGLVAPERVLGLTFTRKAAGELADRVRRQLRAWQRSQGEAGSVVLAAAPTISTYNSYAASVVRDHALRIGHDPEARLLKDGARWQLAHEVVEGFDLEKDPGYTIGTLTAAVLKLSDATAEHLTSTSEARRAIGEILRDLGSKSLGPRQKGPSSEVQKAMTSLEARAVCLSMVERYRERKHELGYLDFADQVALAGRLARIPVVRAGERSRFAVVILDEYQDTSVAQLDFLRELYGEAHPVMAVGDPNQSIYGWRGASAGGLADFVREFPQAPGRAQSDSGQLTLSVAWRNDTAILDVANVLAEPLRDGSAITVPKLRARAGAGTGSVQVVYAHTLTDEAHAVADYLVEHWRDAGAARGEALSAAVLCRKRSQFVELARVLRERGLAVEVVGLGGLLSTPEVVDVVAALQAAHDPSRGDALMRLLTSARMRLGVADLFHLGDWGRRLARTATPDAGAGAAGDAPVVEGDAVDERSIVDAIEQLPPASWCDSRGNTLSSEGRRRMAELAGVLRTLRGLTYLPLSDIVVSAERLLGLDIELAARGGATARAHLDRLVDVAEEFVAGLDSSAATLGAFLDWLEDAQTHEKGLEPGQVDTATDRVQLLTVHASKGLEWDVVVVPGLSDGVFPSLATKKVRKAGPPGPMAPAWFTGVDELPYELRGDREHLPVLEHEGAASRDELDTAVEAFKSAVGAHQTAEERRVVYVATTRARSRLLLTGAWWRSTKDPVEPSLFLDELARAGLVREVDQDSRPSPDEANPVTESAVSGSWPLDPLDTADQQGRRTLVEAASRLVLEAQEALAHGTEPRPAVAGRGMSRERLAELLLAEDAARRNPGPLEVALPAGLSASGVVRLAGDPRAFARELRRPVPTRPSVAALRGTRFHAWVENHFSAPSLVDLDDLPGADDVDGGPDLDLAELQRTFLASEWAGRTPIDVEVAVDVRRAGVALRSRIDAVFSDGDGRYVVVDWKTGRPPSGPEALRERAVQLGVYRLAWAQWARIEPSRVSGAFFYVTTGETVRADGLIDEDELEEILRPDDA